MIVWNCLSKACTGPYLMCIWTTTHDTDAGTMISHSSGPLSAERQWSFARSLWPREEWRRFWWKWHHSCGHRRRTSFGHHMGLHSRFQTIPQNWKLFLQPENHHIGKENRVVPINRQADLKGRKKGVRVDPSKGQTKRGEFTGHFYRKKVEKK